MSALAAAGGTAAGTVSEVVGAVSLWGCAVWASVGVAGEEASSLYGVMKKHKCSPWKVKGEQSFGVWFGGALLRLVAGIVAAVLLGKAGPMSAYTAAAAGMAGPLVMDRVGDMYRHRKPTETPVAAPGVAQVGGVRADEG